MCSLDGKPQCQTQSCRQVGFCGSSGRRGNLLMARRPRRHRPRLAVFSFLTDLLKQRLPDLLHRQAVETGQFERGSQSGLALLLVFDGMEGGNGETSTLGDLLQGQSTLRAQRAQMVLNLARDTTESSRASYPTQGRCVWGNG